MRWSMRDRTLGLLQCLAGLAGAPAALLLAQPTNWYQYSAILFGGAVPAVGGAARATRRLTLDQRRVLLPGVLTVHSVPWERVHGARVDGDRVIVAYEPEQTVTVGPLAPADTDRTDRIAATVAALRERALTDHVADDAEHADGQVRTRLSVTSWSAAAVYAVVIAVTLWWHGHHG